jgi:hypothetical protein
MGAPVSRGKDRRNMAIPMRDLAKKNGVREGSNAAKNKMRKYNDEPDLVDGKGKRRHYGGKKRHDWTESSENRMRPPRK